MEQRPTRYYKAMKKNMIEDIERNTITDILETYLTVFKHHGTIDDCINLLSKNINDYNVELVNIIGSKDNIEDFLQNHAYIYYKALYYYIRKEYTASINIMTNIDNEHIDTLRIYSYGKLNNENLMVSCLVAASMKNNKQALYILAKHYEKKKDYPNMKYYAALAIKCGNPYALYFMGRHYLSLNNNDLGFTYLEEAGRNKHAHSLVDIGTTYMNTKQYDRAIHYFTLATVYEFPLAYLRIAQYHHDYTKDFDKMKGAYLFAITLGDEKAMYLLAKYYEICMNDVNNTYGETSTATDIEKRYFTFLALAYDNGYTAARVELANYMRKKGICINKMKLLYVEGIKEHDPVSIYEYAYYMQYYEKAHYDKMLEYYSYIINNKKYRPQYNQLIEYSLRNMAAYYNSVEKDEKKYIEYHTILATEFKSVASLDILGSIYSQKGDDDKMMEYFKISAEKGSKFAIREMAAHCISKADNEGFLHYMELSAQNGDLDICVEYGKHICDRIVEMSACDVSRILTLVITKLVQITLLKGDHRLCKYIFAVLPNTDKSKLIKLHKIAAEWGVKESAIWMCDFYTKEKNFKLQEYYAFLTEDIIRINKLNQFYIKREQINENIINKIIDETEKELVNSTGIDGINDVYAKNVGKVESLYGEITKKYEANMLLKIDMLGKQIINGIKK